MLKLAPRQRLLSLGFGQPCFVKNNIFGFCVFSDEESFCRKFHQGGLTDCSIHTDSQYEVTRKEPPEFITFPIVRRLQNCLHN